MQPKEFLDQLLDQGKIIRLAHTDGELRVSRGHALILDEKSHIAVMLEDCGSSETTGIRAGDFVTFHSQPEAESLIIGAPTRIG